MNIFKSTLKRNYYTILGVALFSLFISLTFSDIGHATPVTGFDAGHIIDDAMFINSNSMNVTQIQAFLNSKVSSCDASGNQPASDFGRPDLTHAQYAASRGWSAPPYTCLKDYNENGLGSAQIIYNMAQQYQINPQVLIVLLQKEQGLVTDTWPLATQYKTATGYGCPDSAPCDSQYFGLTSQLAWSGKMFHSIMVSSPTWYTPYILGNNYIQYNPDSSCGGSNINIVNRSTQALYNYTPYQPNQAALNAGYGTSPPCGAYGNRNFYLYFTDWFGSTFFTQPLGGLLYRQASTGAIYLVNDSIRYYIPDWQTMTNYGLSNYSAISVNDSVINSLADGGALTNLLWDSNGVYLVNNQERHPVSLDMCTQWALGCFDGQQVKSLSSIFQTQYLKQGPLLTNMMSYNGVTYLITNGKKQPIANSKTVSDLGLSNTVPLNATTVNTNQELGQLLITTPGIVKFYPSQTMYYFNGTKYFSIPDMNTYNSLSLYTIASIPIPESSYNRGDAISSTPIGYWMQDSSGNKYVINNGQKIPLNLSQQKYWPNANYLTGLDNILSSLGTSNLGEFAKVGVSYYKLNSNLNYKHYINSMADYANLGGTISNTSFLNDYIGTQIKDGQSAFPDGTLVKIDGNPEIYAINGDQLLYISSMEILNSFNLDTSRVVIVSSSNQYQLSTLSDFSKLSDGTTILKHNNSLLELSPTQATVYGIRSDYVYTPISLQFIRRATITQSTNFIRNADNGNIYYATNGELQHIGSIETYKNLGGTPTTLTTVNSQIIDLFKMGKDI